MDALVEGDRSAYLAAFDPVTVERKRAAGDPVEGMFDFMGGVIDARGAVTRFHPLSDRGIRAAGTGCSDGGTLAQMRAGG